MSKTTPYADMHWMPLPNRGVHGWSPNLFEEMEMRLLELGDRVTMAWDMQECCGFPYEQYDPRFLQND